MGEDFELGDFEVGGGSESEEAVVVEDVDEETVGADYVGVPVGLEGVCCGPAEDPLVFLYMICSWREM